ncbi:hypothetical protein SUGI_0643970 [Cryptomeria japonica]|uniref:cyclin-U2-2 n=1 Tax=Cryptomeria japonica TaxID=3369 RepID=UPI002414901C|nr:cyclin-U2-2 [Cryptomeria japonica]GLJ31987.1 hypothetical protein SUGI_0643970 [Cryptomeria japonica]
MSSKKENNIVNDDVSPGRIRSDLYSFQTGFPAEMPSVISVLSSIVERAVVRNERLAASYRPISRPAKYCVFDGFEVPDMSIERYLGRIFRYVNCSPSVFVVAYAYIDRLIQMHPNFRITCLNVHRLLITSVMVASKFVEDINYPNSYYARVAGVISTEEMNKLEIEFLFLMGFKFHVTVNVFESYCCHLEREVALGGGFQIERSLRFFCEIDQSSAVTRKYCKNHRHFLRCVYHKS